MKKVLKNKWFRMGLGLFVTALLFVLGHHEAAGGVMVANAAVVDVVDDPALSETDKKVLEAVKKMMAQQLKDAQMGLITKEQMEAQFKELRKGLKETELKAFNDILTTQGQLINKIKEGNGGSQATPSIREQLKAFMEGNTDKWAAFKSGEIKSLSIVLKDPATMTKPNAATFQPQQEILPGLVDLQRNQPFILQYVNTGSTLKSQIIWSEKTSPEGNATFIGEGELKPLVDFTFATKSTDAKKVADKIKTSTEMLDDIDFMAAEIENELQYLVSIAIDNGVLTGDGLGDNLKGITEYASAYNLTTVITADANNYDAIKAASTQIKSLNFQANYAFVNPIDAANMELQKASDGHYIIPPFKSADGTTVSGVRVIESNQIAVGYVLVADTSRSKVRMYKDFSITYGWVNDDFEKNFVTIIGEARLHHFIADNHTGAFVYDTFSNIKTAITDPGV